MYGYSYWTYTHNANRHGSSFNIAYSNDGLWDTWVSPAAPWLAYPRTHVRLTMRSVSNFNFSKTRIRPNNTGTGVNPANYIPTGTDTSNWFTIQIPISAWNGLGHDISSGFQFLSFQYQNQNNNGQVAIRDITFTGGGASDFVFFGPSKQDNYTEANGLTPASKVAVTDAGGLDGGWRCGSMGTHEQNKRPQGSSDSSFQPASGPNGPAMYGIGQELSLGTFAVVQGTQSNLPAQSNWPWRGGQIAATIVDGANCSDASGVLCTMSNSYNNAIGKFNAQFGQKQGLWYGYDDSLQLDSDYKLYTGWYVEGAGNTAVPDIHFGKANGLGDLEVMCDGAPVAIGNRVFQDGDGDGVQDPGESGLSGVEVKLMRGQGTATTTIATAVTDPSGLFMFNSETGTSTGSVKYGITQLSFGQSGLWLKGPATVSIGGLPHSVTRRNSGANGRADSDAFCDGGTSTFAITEVGANNLDLDFGYVNGSTTADCLFAVGNRVWSDTNSNGIQDDGEPNVAGYTVELIDNATDTVVQTTTSTTTGYYFDGVAPGTYKVRVSGLQSGETWTTPNVGEAGGIQTITPFAGHNDFSVYVKDEAILSDGEVDAAVAIGGDVTVTGEYRLANTRNSTVQVAGDSRPVGLVVGGQLDLSHDDGEIRVESDGYVKVADPTGSLLASDAPTLIVAAGGAGDTSEVRLEVSQSSASVYQPGVVNFETKFTEFEAQSDVLTTCVNNMPGRSGATLTIDPVAHRTNVIHLTAADLSAITTIHFNGQPTATAPVLFDIDITGAYTWTLPNFTGVGVANKQFALLSFRSTLTTLTINGSTTIPASILAPYTEVVNNGAVIEGTVAFRAYRHNQGENRYQPFNTTLTCGSAIVDIDTDSDVVVATGVTHTFTLDASLPASEVGDGVLRGAKIMRLVDVGRVASVIAAGAEPCLLPT